MQVATSCPYYGVAYSPNVGVVWMKLLQLKVNEKYEQCKPPSMYSKTKDSVVYRIL